MGKIGTTVTMIAITMLAFTSCKKHYTCTCNIHTDADTSSSATVNATDDTIIYDFGKTSKQTAQNVCAAREQSQTLSYVGMAKVKCNLN